MDKLENWDKNLIKSEIDIKEEPMESYEEYVTINDVKSESENHQKEASEIGTDDLHLEKSYGINFGKLEVKHEDTFDEVQDAIIEYKDFDIKPDIEIKNEDIEFDNDVIWKTNIVETNRKITKEIFDSPSPSSSRFGNGKLNIIELENEEREKEGNKIKDFESCNRIKLDAKLCEYKRNLKGNLKMHSLVHLKVELFKCSECDYDCIRKGHLYSHLLSHSNTKLFKCSECDYECNRLGDMNRHFLSHSNTKLFKCSECDYRCNRKSSLHHHLLSHSNMKLFKCSECDYECTRKDRLKVHLLSHTNIKLFKCSECDYECNQKCDLRRHILSHSNKTLKDALNMENTDFLLENCKSPSHSVKASESQSSPFEHWTSSPSPVVQWTSSTSQSERRASSPSSPKQWTNSLHDESLAEDVFSSIISETSQYSYIEEIPSSSKKNYSTDSVLPAVYTLEGVLHLPPKSKSRKTKRQRGKLSQESAYLRKKEQNKQAALRYRAKKKKEDEQLMKTLEEEEERKAKLKTKQDELKQKVQFMKKLLRETFIAKGLVSPNAFD